MKNTLLLFAVLAIFASCTQQPPQTLNTTNSAASADSIQMNDYNEWKAQQEQPASQQTFTSNGVNATATVVEPRQMPQVIYREVPQSRPRVVKASNSRRTSVDKTPEAETRTGRISKPNAPETNGTTRDPYGRGANDSESTTAGSTGTTGTDAKESGNSTAGGDVAVNKPDETPAKKDGMSKATKGGVIGGASGAVLGAIISKNKVKGAVIGGVVGAAGGYIFGRSQDKKDGRN